MRAEEFADKYNINTSAVRYYAEKAMFTPKGENAQYIVDKACIVQMGRIMQYKKYDFTLEEIEELFYCEGASWMYQKIIVPEACWDVIMAGPFSCNFLLKNLKSLPENAVCIVTDYPSKKSKRCKSIPIAQPR